MAHGGECRICSRLNAADPAIDGNAFIAGMRAEKPDRQRHVGVDVITHIESRAFGIRIEDADLRRQSSLISASFKIDQLRKRSPMACFMTAPPTSEIDLVSGISLGQTSTQFCA
jgi:hypothetical protein